MADVNVNVPSVYLSDLDKLANKVREITDKEDTEISFEFIIASLFPTSWKNIQDELNHQYLHQIIEKTIYFQWK